MQHEFFCRRSTSQRDTESMLTDTIGRFSVPLLITASNDIKVYPYLLVP